MEDIQSRWKPVLPGLLDLNVTDPNMVAHFGRTLARQREAMVYDGEGKRRSRHRGLVSNCDGKGVT